MEKEPNLISTHLNKISQLQSFKLLPQNIHNHSALINIQQQASSISFNIEGEQVKINDINILFLYIKYSF